MDKKKKTMDRHKGKKNHTLFHSHVKVIFFPLCIYNCFFPLCNMYLLTHILFFKIWITVYIPLSSHFSSTFLKSNFYWSVVTLQWCVHFYYRLPLLFSKAQMLSCVWLCDSMNCIPPGPSVHGISRQEYWSGVPFPSPGDLPDLGIKSLPVYYICLGKWILYH